MGKPGAMLRAGKRFVMSYKGGLSVHVVRYPALRNKAGRATTVAITVFVYGSGRRGSAAVDGVVIMCVRIVR